MQHDKHTYYFEKYLRKEMSREEKDAFERKLKIDFNFKNNFDKYAANHDEILKQELAEYFDEEIIPTKPKNYTWIWVLFSVLGIVLIVDYYANQKYIEDQKTNQTYKEVLVTRFKNAFVDPIKKITSKITYKKQESDTTLNTINTFDENNVTNDTLIENSIDSTAIETKIFNQFQQLMNIKNAGNNEKDILVNDSLMVVIDLEKFKEKYKLITNSTDSLLADSLVNRLTLQALVKQSNGVKPLFVEFWQSVIGFSGYQFSGKKLVLYGVNKPFDIFILKQNSLYILHSKWGEIALQADNQLHKFED